uniref:Uncharacterized protein n=1 Tax=Corethron hystrix TaxID=216773 RepID=A0A7S1FLD0_9STRA|mmetsp:Transcript_13606/g.30014  ORF Transcript_13606/g.30014 Transcript_13606/m.30014 type:complete len:298 (+) Transcript_13606:106-999(+)
MITKGKLMGKSAVMCDQDLDPRKGCGYATPICSASSNPNHVSMVHIHDMTNKLTEKMGVFLASMEEAFFCGKFSSGAEMKRTENMEIKLSEMKRDIHELGIKCRLAQQARMHGKNEFDLCLKEFNELKERRRKIKRRLDTEVLETNSVVSCLSTSISEMKSKHEASESCLRKVRRDVASLCDELNESETTARLAREEDEASLCRLRRCVREIRRFVEETENDGCEGGMKVDSNNSNVVRQIEIDEKGTNYHDDNKVLNSTPPNDPGTAKLLRKMHCMRVENDALLEVLSSMKMNEKG